MFFKQKTQIIPSRDGANSFERKVFDEIEKFLKTNKSHIVSDSCYGREYIIEGSDYHYSIRKGLDKITLFRYKKHRRVFDQYTSVGACEITNASIYSYANDLYSKLNRSK